MRKEVRRKEEGAKKGSAIKKFRIYEERFPERFTGFQDPPIPTRCSTKIDKSIKMANINVESVSEEELIKKW